MTEERRVRVFIGIPAYSSVPGETLEDYCRFMYHLGRRNTEYDFFLGIKTKSEQFRARNSLVDAALSVGADYLFMLDDDHVIDWRGTNGPTDAYDIVKKLIAHKKDIVGALYYHRGGECLPVLMKEGKDGGFYYMRDDEITGGLQEVAVQGGGCMLINTNVFSRVKSPWFEPEFKYGTDIQICTKAKEQGYSVWCDTSIVVGHVKSTREVVTPENRFRVISESYTGHNTTSGGLDQFKLTKSALSLFQSDAEEYLGMSYSKMMDLKEKYWPNMERFASYDDKKEYYRSLGPEQIARQVWFNTLDEKVMFTDHIFKMVNTRIPGYGLDFGCGSAPASFELALRGHRMDFIDVDGSPAYEFTKWRAKKRGINCGWDWGGPYDYILALDAFEHVSDWKSVVDRMAETLKPNACIVTNFMYNNDFANIEHINMDKRAFKDYLVSKGIYPLNEVLWIKRDLAFMDKKPAEESAA